MTHSTARIEVRLHAIRYETASINTYEFHSLHEVPLPPFEAGAHINLHLPNGLVRSYSLCNDPKERNRYVVGVDRSPSSRGGSRCVHETLRVGMTLQIDAPVNNFPLQEDAHHTLLIAGGIGITPLMSMLKRLESLDRPWTLYYCTRSPEVTAFLTELKPYGPRVHLIHDNGTEAKRLRFDPLIRQQHTDTHIYCCGPTPMLESFEAARARSQNPGRFHLEYFASKEASATDSSFTIKLVRSGRTLQVDRGRTILETVLNAGVTVPYSCSQGVCGSCETAVLEGIPDHRDMVLTATERAQNRSMMICCSGCKGDSLTLDL